MLIILDIRQMFLKSSEHALVIPLESRPFINANLVHSALDIE